LKSLFSWIEFPNLGDDRGSLVAIEFLRFIPFTVKRIYYIFGTSESVTRGLHAHVELEQVAICISGKCRMIFDDGELRQGIWMDSPSKALVVPKRMWHEMDSFSSDCVLLLLASEQYDEKDYIRSYDNFLSFVKK
jgi:UDP-2-acetamido-3-amino-2,3-dideoxy-glucuronate N-acetyltransferase